MALSSENEMVMPVAPMYGGANGANAFGGDWAWIILLLLLAGGNGFGFGGGFGADGLYPWLNNSQNINGGFRDSLMNDYLTGIRDGISGLSTQLCNGFASAEAAASSRQMADMQQGFAMQTAMSQGFNSVQGQLAQCCCDNRLATANLSALVQSENCADRAALSDGIRDIIVSNNANTQKILDTLCQDKIDAKNEKIADLERQLTMANLAASQTAQTSKILADNAAQTVSLEQYLNPVPIPAYLVQNPNCCTSGYGCSCG